ncbi:MAG TPA: leucine-rich repeat domain-containing protein, partial [Humisphaera sp.]
SVGTAPSVATAPSAAPAAATAPARRAVPPEQQAALFAAEMRRLNPAYDLTNVESSGEPGGTWGVWCYRAGELTDLAPFTVMSNLRELRVFVEGGGGPRDLAPIRGMPLTALAMQGCGVDDLAPLAGMPLVELSLWQSKVDSEGLRVVRSFPNLTRLNCGGGQGLVRDLSALRGLRLESLCINYTDVDDLSPLAGMPLRTLLMQRTRVTDLRPLAGMPLEELRLEGTPAADLTPLRGLPLKKLGIDYDATRHAALLRAIPTLTEINGRPAAEVLGGAGR